MYERSNSPLSVTKRSSQDVANLIADVRNKMQTMLEEKEKAVLVGTCFFVLNMECSCLVVEKHFSQEICGVLEVNPGRCV